jgi:hypothetical protein
VREGQRAVPGSEDIPELFGVLVRPTSTGARATSDRD